MKNTFSEEDILCACVCMCVCACVCINFIIFILKIWDLNFYVMIIIIPKQNLLFYCVNQNENEHFLIHSKCHSV